MTLLYAAGMLFLFTWIWFLFWRNQHVKPFHPKPTPLFKLSDPTHILISDAPPLLGGTFSRIPRNDFEKQEKMTWTNSPVSYPNTLRHLKVVLQKDPMVVDTFNDFVICDIHPSVGKGVFATKCISKGTVLGIYTGMLEIGRGEGGPYALNAKMRNKPPFFYDAARFRNATSYIQHAPETEIVSDMATANVGMQNSIYGGVPLMLYVTTRDIEPHEQLLVNYGKDYWRRRKPRWFDKEGKIIPSSAS